MTLRSSSDEAARGSSPTVPASYIIGSIASYWLIDRLAGFWQRGRFGYQIDIDGR